VKVQPGQPIVDVVIPVYNEENDLAGCIRTLDDYLSGLYPAGGPGYSITIADNASTDQTPNIGAALADDLDQVRYLRLEEKGRGRALRRAWLTSPAPVLAYMDVDLSTGLSAFPALVAPLISGHSDVAIGSPSGTSSPAATTCCSRAASAQASPTRNAASRPSART
jgi:glycosyltransferase involved in cell wall biosynthesis